MFRTSELTKEGESLGHRLGCQALDQNIHYDVDLILAKTKEMWEVMRLTGVRQLTQGNASVCSYALFPQIGKPAVPHYKNAMTPESITSLGFGTPLLPPIPSFCSFPS